MDILDKIIELRKARGWSNYRLSKQAGIPTSTITNLIKNGNSPSISTLTSICRAFGMTLGQFFDEDPCSSLTTEENELLRNWSLMTDIQREKVMIYMSGLLQK